MVMMISENYNNIESKISELNLVDWVKILILNKYDTDDTLDRIQSKQIPRTTRTQSSSENTNRYQVEEKDNGLGILSTKSPPQW